MENISITDMRTVPGDSAFLLDDGSTAILYDTGFGFTGHALAEKVKAALGSRPLDYIFLTHSHYDHALGSAYVAKVFPNVQVVAAEYAREVFQRPSARSVMRALDRRVAALYGTGEYEDLSDLLKVDIAVKDADSLTCGSMRFTVIGLPGHTKCSIGFYLAENKLLLGTETLGVRFGTDTYLPSCLVGYQLTLDAYRKVGGLEIDRMLLPHCGIVEAQEAAAYLEKSEQVTRDTAQIIKSQLLDGRSPAQIANYLEKILYKAHVAPVYPVDAFRLNTQLMIKLIQNECL